MELYTTSKLKEAEDSGYKRCLTDVENMLTKLKALDNSDSLIGAILRDYTLEEMLVMYGDSIKSTPDNEIKPGTKVAYRDDGTLGVVLDMYGEDNTVVAVFTENNCIETKDITKLIFIEDTDCIEQLDCIVRGKKYDGK